MSLWTAPQPILVGPMAVAPAAAHRSRYLTLLGWAFTMFNSVRVFAYLPTMWTLVHSGDSAQHSLWTWFTWFGANATMALWLRERNGGCFDKASGVNLCNASMCGVMIALILWLRW